MIGAKTGYTLMDGRLEAGMAAPDVHKADPHRLARILALDSRAARTWKPEELSAILDHQLSAAVQFDLRGLDEPAASKLRALTEARGLLGASFADLLHHPDPPVELLQLTKLFAKACGSHPDSPLPREIAQVLYFVSIAVAMMRYETMITALGEDALRSGLTWVIDQPWVDEGTRSLCRRGFEHLDARGRRET